ncbi:HdeD family acid-resistance protein [Bradyrhizobium sp. CB1717]|uniref:HdeD family acid-resistance protein n=1 Tax=Bradyrhizobium sp. CB1717 TaxID=3039154 RepID=UPI0024B132D9|nr:HdeD family acid-resistance protein [Bradyrhizobium sp. CB1717]WFU22651.1 HdeD family acid-resistance protein [Bradyrhizobium sp. CB1717]
MTSASDTSHHPSLGSGIAALHAKWGWIVALGVVYLIAGFVALGAMMIVAGVTEIIGAFQMKSWGKFLIWALLGVLYVIAGFLTFENPLFAAVLLTLFLGVSLIASGAVRLFLAFSMKRESPWIWVALSAVITLLLGLLIVARWPVNSVYILGLFLGIDLIMAGAGWISLGFSLKRRG